MLLVVTSISPRHHNAQAQAIAMKSWAYAGMLISSINSPEECDALAKEYPTVEFIRSSRASSGLFKAPYAPISAMIDLAIERGAETCILVNSDIELRDPDGILSAYIEMAKDGLIFANRHDHNGDGMNPTRYDHGFDVFIINRIFFRLLPQTLFVMGQTWWDYWIPWRFMESGIPIQLVNEPIFLHHRHPVQYDQKEWERMTEHFAWVEGHPVRGKVMTGRVAQQITNDVYRQIRRHAR